MIEGIDSRSWLTEKDPHGMLGLTEGFADQCEAAIAIGHAGPLPTLPEGFRSVIITGLGGSAAGGDFIRAVMEAEGSAPVMVNRDYHLPTWVGPRDLVIACSYSGSTEETLSAYEEASRAGATIMAVTSGGELKKRCDSVGAPVMLVPGGQPPRTAMGYMMFPALVALERLGLLAAQAYDEVVAELKAGVKKWSTDAPFASNPAKAMAVAFFGAVPILYGLGPAAAVVASRWKSQIHENSKSMAFANGFPELNHNEILGWVNAGEQGVGRWVGAILKLKAESVKMETRSAVSQKLIGATCEFSTAEGSGKRVLSQMLSLASLGDFVSIYMARLYEVDPENIDSINTLKAELAKAP